MKPVLRPFQIDAVNRVTEAAKTAKVIVLQSPTGSGKTTMGCELIGRAAAKGASVLEIVHRRKLVDQFSERLFEHEIDHGILMRGHRLEKDCKIQVASRDTLLSRCVRNEYFDLPPAQLVVVDEGRHAASAEFRALLAHYEARGAWIVLLDATPVLADGRGLGPWAKAIVKAASVTELIKQGYLVPVKCYAPDRKNGRGGKVKRGIAGDLVESWKQYAESMPTVLFCSRVQHSLDAVQAFRAAGIRAEHVDADTPDDVRDRFYDGLEGGDVQIVSNVGIIKEGVDIPCLGCCQFYMDPSGRVGFLQGCGRIMRPYPGKSHGVLIDHAGAVFRHGFPDEDTEWTLEGNVDEDFEKKHKDGQTQQVLYCKHCELIYHSSPTCPQCGRAPGKPPRSIFAPPPVDATNELLTEADRKGMRGMYDREEKIKHWFRCLGVSANSGGTFSKARVIYQKKYGEWPEDNFPCQSRNWSSRVADVYPKFDRRRRV